MGRIGTREPSIDLSLVFRVGCLPKVKEKGGNFALLFRREGSDAALDFFNAHVLQHNPIVR